LVNLGSLRFSPAVAKVTALVFLPGVAVAKLIDVGSMASYFESLDDPRQVRNRLHRLTDVLVICVAAVVCGCDGPTAIHRWAVNRKDWLAGLLPLPHGIPSRDCIRRILIAIQPEAFQQCFQAWAAAALSPSRDPAMTPAKRLVAIDGKTCRGSHDESKSFGPLHLVSAWASEEGLALGQVATEDKSNEITAIPVLLKQIGLADTIVTIDAMGCQKEIVEQIVTGKGDAVIAVKKNQPNLHDAIASVFREQLERDFEDLQYRQHETSEQGHGRSDGRVYFLAKVPGAFAPAKEWPQVKAIGYAARYTVRDDGTEQFDVRYYLSTRYLSGKRFAEAVRGHWSIESMHWTLDVTFREDDHRTRERTMGNNLSWLRRFAVSLLKHHPEQDSLKGKMLRCAYNTDFLMQVLQFQRI
jgi:predicted transposase YbfD/YdcC